MPLALPQWHATRISWAQTWMSGWQLAPEKFPQLYQRFHPQALRYHHPCWSERKHLLFNQPLTAWTDRMALFQGLSMSTPSPPQVYGAAATHRWIQTTHIEAAATARDVTQDTVSENRYRQQLNFRFFLSSCQFHFTDGRAGFPHPRFQTSFPYSLYYRYPTSACSTNNPPHLSRASLQSEWYLL